MLDFMFEIFEQRGGEAALIWKDRPYTFEYLLQRIDHWREWIVRENILPGTAVVLGADYSADSVALLLALIAARTIVIPIGPGSAVKRDEYAKIAQAELVLDLNAEDSLDIKRLVADPPHPLYKQLRESDHPGLVLFSSGSTGKVKAAVHDLSKLLQKYKTRRRNLRTLAFLLLDHIGGIDTLLYSLSNGSCLIIVQERAVEAICQAIQKHRVEVLPATPTFLQLLILSGVHRHYDLSSLKIITYGTEVMPEVTLKRSTELFPDVRFLQKYGTTEIGTLRSKSRSSDSPWVKIGGEGYEVRVREGMLEVKAASAMLGYINAPSPFTDDGWFITGDAVEVDGEYLRILGRTSEIINVGGQKVYPAEVENAIGAMPEVVEALVYGEANAILGQIVCAEVRLAGDDDPVAFTRRLKKHCVSMLESYKVPVKVRIGRSPLHSPRFKKIREAATPTPSE
jgi:acyl-coenzyme A synthetase/AMP-(fatty) acid ligase